MITIGFPNDQLEHGIYDLKLLVFNAEDNELVAELGPEERNFSNQQFETLGEDTPPAASEPVSSIQLEKKTENRLTVYPNPFESFLSIVSENIRIEETAIIRLIDLRGTLIIEKSVETATMQSNELTINNLNELSPGIYLLELQMSDWIGQILVLKR
jgi:hypothetical protein